MSKWVITLFILFTSATATAATFTVNQKDGDTDVDASDANIGDGVCDADLGTGGNQCSLRAAIEEANHANNSGADEIQFSLAGCPCKITLASTGLDNITESLTITGLGADQLTIDANGATTSARVFNFNSTSNDQTFNLSGLELTGGQLAGGNGVGVLVGSGETLNIDSCHITGNTATSGTPNGGGVSGTSSTITIINSTIDNNEAGNFGGGLHTNGGTLIVKNSTIHDNTTSGPGGGIGIVGAAATATLVNVTVTNNDADDGNANTWFGGGLADDSAGGSISVLNSIIADNKASGVDDNCDGSGISSNGNNIESGSDCGFTAGADQQNTDPLLRDLADNGGDTMTRALLPGSPAIDAGNDTPCSTDPDINFLDQRGHTRSDDADGDGMVICDVGAFELQVYVVDSLADGSDFSTADGYCDTDDSDGDGPCTLRAAIEQANAVNRPGPEAIHFSVTGTINTTAVLSASESVAIYGPGQSNLTIDNGQNSRVLQFSSSTNDNTFTLSGMTISNGLVGGAAGGIFVSNGETVTLSDCTVSGNESNLGSSGNGGGIGANVGSDLTINNCTISGNTASASGGGIATSNGTLTISNSTISGNTSTATITSVGGGIACDSCTLDITNSTISGNQTNHHGGGLAVLFPTATLNNVTIVDNDSDLDNSDGGIGNGNGGGIYQSSGGTITLKNTLLAGNRSNGGTGPDCSGNISSAEYNIVGDDSGCTYGADTGDQVDIIFDGTYTLAGIINLALADNGGPTQTHALAANSPAIDTGDGAGCRDKDGVLLDTDQRGFTRPVNSVCDVGAYENGTCGDGEVDGGETCDDSGESATCDDDCSAVSCGDGNHNAMAGEACDDGGESASCDDDCTAVSCGDGNVNAAAGEDCDDSGESATCDDDCTDAVCGDGTTNATAGEACDDGNTTDGDGCQSDCQFPVCGDGIVDAGEECDDGNAADGDGCAADCTTETTSGGVCGDGTLDTGEECDDGNTTAGDGCAADCTNESGDTNGNGSSSGGCSLVRR